ncbi:MAG: ribose-5-phosphate isomerase RpiA [Chlamydiales bacterium]
MKLNPYKQDEIKKGLGQEAAKLVQNGMLVGLGTGTTATYFIDSLIERCRQGLKIEVVSSSVRSQERAAKGGIPVIDMNRVVSIDLSIDGADEIDPKNRMIKGGGGAHVREKIVASASKLFVVIVDESKLVDCLGKFGLPIEILSFGLASTINKLEKLGYHGSVRKTADSLYITDNGNYIFDIHAPDRFENPEKDHDAIVNIPGVVDSGFFLTFPQKCWWDTQTEL